MATPRSIRFDERTLSALGVYSLRHAGLTASAAAALLVDEGLRMDSHPGVIFRDGPMGRRAVLIGGPDVWEAIRLMRSVVEAEPGLGSEERLAIAAENSGVTASMLRTALDYYGEFPEEIDQQITRATEAEQVLRETQERTRELLGS
jgi:hypothetical protein